MTDEEIVAGFRAAAEQLVATTRYKRELAAQYEDIAGQLRRDARKIERSVAEGKWWELCEVLSQETLDHLAEYEPVDRQDLLDEDAWA